MGGDRRKGAASGRSHLPKTPAGRARQLEKVARRRERLQRELADARRAEAAVAAAVRADRERTRAGLERAVGRMLLNVVEKKRALAADGDERAQQNLDYWMKRIDRAVDAPDEREMAGLPARGPPDRGNDAESGPRRGSDRPRRPEFGRLSD